MIDVLVRTEEPNDCDAIREITRAAFEGKAYSDGTEAPIIDALRNAGELTISLVAAEKDQIVGHVAFSPVTINGKNVGWFGLGPVSVLPDRQKRGIGSKLIRFGLDDLKKRDAKGCLLVGDPNYYSRFGFRTTKAMTYREGLEKYFQILSFGAEIPSGQVEFHESFGE